jgi:GTPase SAR1 family protein
VAQLLSRRELTNAYEQVRDKLSDLETPAELLVFVVGEGNFGKSSLINRLLGRDVAEVSFLPKTWRVDLYRTALSGVPEHAQLRRAEQEQVERLSIAEAREACQAQEAMIKLRQREAKAAGQEVPCGTFPGQIVEVQWHYRGLALPPGIVLVDTPGFSQFRAGLNEARTEVLGGSRGIVFDIWEVYEQYYHRANLVLWVFKATKLNDQDTIQTFEELCARGKEILGILTYVDAVPPEQRGELLDRARGCFGHGVHGFVPVVAGGKSPEVGLGIEDLRRHLTALEPWAEAVKLQEMEAFCRFQAQSGLQWVQAIGDSLIHNVMQISLYCNATSGRLLQEMRTRHNAIREEYFQRIGGADRERRRGQHLVPGLRRILTGLANHESIRWSVFGVSLEQEMALGRLFQQEIAEILAVSWLEKHLPDEMLRVSDYVTMEGVRVAAGQRLRQVAIGSAGRSTTRPIQTHIEPPDVGDLRVALPSVNMPPPPGGLWNNIRRFFGIFGGAVVDENAVRNTAVTLDAEVESLGRQILEVCQRYTRSVANAIVKSGERALGHVYPDDNFRTLGGKAGGLDGDLAALSRLSGKPTAEPKSPYRYATLYRIWSPRDDIRLAAIELFSEWFDGEWPCQHDRVTAWIDPHLEEAVLDQQCVYRACRRYLRGQELRVAEDETAGPRTVSLGETHVMRLGDDALVQRLRSRLDALAASLRSRIPFNETEIAGRILEEFEYLDLRGVAAAFSTHLANDFRNNIDREMGRMHLPEVRSESSLRIGIREKVLASIGVALTAGLGDLFATSHLLTALSFTSPLLPSVCSACLAAGLSAALPVRWLRRYERGCHDRSIARQMAAEFDSRLARALRQSWEECVRSLNRETARSVVGSMTLVKKRPLDYAFEGAFQEYV